jgi:hypothetical protein
MLKRKPADGLTHWSTRKLGSALSISRMMVARVWAKHGLKPQRLDRCMASNDPDFERKAADIIGLYVNPPAHAAVFCVDETIQGLYRKDPVLPLSAGREERHGFEYYRHGGFAKIERDVIARGVFTSVSDLRRKLTRYIRQYDKARKTIKWRYRDPYVASLSNQSLHATLVVCKTTLVKPLQHRKIGNRSRSNQSHSNQSRKQQFLHC